MTARLEQLRFGAMGTACSVTVTMDARSAWPAERALAAARGEVAASARSAGHALRASIVTVTLHAVPMASKRSCSRDRKSVV